MILKTHLPKGKEVQALPMAGSDENAQTHRVLRLVAVMLLLTFGAIYVLGERDEVPPLPTAERTMREGLAALYRQRNPSQAVELFTAVLAQAPEHYGAHFQLAVALEQSGRVPEALARYDAMRRLATQANDAETLRLIEARVAAIQTSPDAVMAEGLRTLYERRDGTSAVRYFRRVLELQPAHYGAHFQLAASLQASGDHDAARDAYQRALRLAQQFRDQPSIELIESRLAQIGP